jgi:hypothetical protein
MTKVRRRVVRFALLLQVTGIEPVFVGCTYREMQAGLEKQLSVLPSNRRRAVRSQASRLISKTEVFKNAGDQLVPSLHQQKSSRRQTPIENYLQQMRRCSQERCGVRFAGCAAA